MAAEPRTFENWKSSGGETETDEESDFYFTSRPPRPPPAVVLDVLPPTTTASAALRTPDTSFHAFDDDSHNSLDTTPRIGKKKKMPREEAACPRDASGESMLFPVTFPSLEFLSEVSLQLEKHSFSGGHLFVETPVGTGGGRRPANPASEFVPGFDSPSLESLTLNPLYPNDGRAIDSFGTTSSTASRQPQDMMTRTPERAAAGPCGGISPSPIRGGPRAAAFDPFQLGSDDGRDETDASPIQLWTDRALQTLAKVTASESNDECDEDNNNNSMGVKGGGEPETGAGRGGEGSHAFSKDLFHQEEASKKSSQPAKVPSPPRSSKPSLYSSPQPAEISGAGGDDEVPSLEWSFTSQGSSSASSRAASKAGQFLSQVVGRCYACTDEESDIPNLVNREQHGRTNPPVHLYQQLHIAKEKSAAVVDEAMRAMVALFGDSVPSFVVTMTSKTSSSRGNGRNHSKGGGGTSRRHRRFPSGSTFDYSESQNPTTTGEMSNYTTSDGEGTSFDDDYYYDDDDDEEEEFDDYDEDDDDGTRSSARGGSENGGGTSSVGTGREGAVDMGEEGGDFYSPRVVGDAPVNRRSRARHDPRRKGTTNRRQNVESISPSFNATSSSSSSPSWMKDPLVKVNQGVHKLFGDAALALSHATSAPPGPGTTRRASASPVSGHRSEDLRRGDELERANDRFAC